MECTLCGSENNIEIHHINYEEDETVPLCRDCHNKVHSNPDHSLYPDTEFEGEAAKVSSDGKVTIPKEARAFFDIGEGDAIYFENDSGKLVIYKMKPIRDK